MLVLWRCAQGWRIGFRRKTEALLSLMGGLAAAYWLGAHMASFLPQESFGHPFAIETAGTILVGFSGYLCLRLLFVAIRQVKSDDNESSVNRMGGLFIGLTESLFWIWAFALIIRWSAELSEAYVLAKSPEGISPDLVLEKETSELNFAARAAVYWNRRSRNGSASALLDKIDPIPQEFYELRKNLVVLARNPIALEKFAKTPEVVKFMKDPALMELAANPDVVRLYERKEYLKLAQKPLVYELVKDPAFLKRLQDANMHKALSHAVQLVRGKNQG